MARIYIGLGSNIGGRKENLEAAITMLFPEVTVISVSSVYETDPWGYEDQAAFLNQVISADTDLSPRALLDKLKAIEKDMGRIKTFRFGPRVIDLDLLYYEDLILNSIELQIPHPRIKERAFVLIPLCEIAPDLIHPVLVQSTTELCAEIDQKGVRTYEEG